MAWIASASSQPAPTGNSSSDKLLNMPEKGQAAMLSKATHYACYGKNPYYVGTISRGVNRNVSFWSITCDNDGRKFMIVIAPDAVGSTQIYECKLLHKRPWQCYTKLKEK